MNPKPDAWDRLAGAARKAGRPPADCVPASSSIPWLPALESRVRALFLRLLWRRSACWAAILAASLLITVWMLSRPSNSSPVPAETHLIPIPTPP